MLIFNFDVDVHEYLFIFIFELVYLLHKGKQTDRPTDR